jgi:hypothetical protein
MPWNLTPAERRALNRHSRRLVSPPAPGEQIDGNRRLGGVKVADLLLLAALDDLAGQGNEVARHAAGSLRARLGIDAVLHSHADHPA